MKEEAGGLSIDGQGRLQLVSRLYTMRMPNLCRHPAASQMEG